MRALIVSDLHLEWQGWDPEFLKKLQPADMIILAGDISSEPYLEHHLELICDQWPIVIHVPGNHEYYNSSFRGIDDLLSQLSTDIPNLYVLNSGVEKIDGQKFVGGTLWFKKWKEDGSAALLNDFNAIRDIHTVLERNDRDTRLFKQSLDRSSIAISHHMPTWKSVSEQYLITNNALNQFFVCDIEYVITDKQPHMWIHGHTHDSKDYKIGSTRVLCNPFGYWKHTENPQFNPGLVIDLDN